MGAVRGPSIFLAMSRTWERGEAGTTTVEGPNSSSASRALARKVSPVAVKTAGVAPTVAPVEGAEVVWTPGISLTSLTPFTYADWMPEWSSEPVGACFMREEKLSANLVVWGSLRPTTMPGLVQN